MSNRRAFYGCIRAERGATMLEYALMVTFIAVVVATALVSFGPAVSDLFSGAATSL